MSESKGTAPGTPRTAQPIPIEPGRVFPTLPRGIEATADETVKALKYIAKARKATGADLDLATVIQEMRAGTIQPLVDPQQKQAAAQAEIARVSPVLGSNGQPLIDADTAHPIMQNLAAPQGPIRASAPDGAGVPQNIVREAKGIQPPAPIRASVPDGSGRPQAVIRVAEAHK